MHWLAGVLPQSGSMDLSTGQAAVTSQSVLKEKSLGADLVTDPGFKKVLTHLC